MVAESSAGPNVGVLALQGAFAKHVEMLAGCGVEAFEVRTIEQLERCDGLVLPGGESTTMLNLLESFELNRPLEKMLADGLPTFGTCAGMILLAHRVLDGRPGQFSFDAIDIDVRRNGYGRQINSFEARLDISGLNEPGASDAGSNDAGPSESESNDADHSLPAAFIRAPLVERAGDGVTVLAEHESHPVLCRQGPILVAAFHPELTGDDRLHRYFLRRMVGIGTA